MKELTDLLDKVILGDDKAYYEFRLKCLSPEYFGKWQFSHTLKYLCKKAKKDSITLEKCCPEVLVDLGIHVRPHLAASIVDPEVKTFPSLLKQAAEKDNTGALAALVFLHNYCCSTVLLTNSDLEKLLYPRIDSILSQTDNKDSMYLAGVFYKLVRFIGIEFPAKYRGINSTNAEMEDKSVQFFENAAKLGHAGAMYELGNALTKDSTTDSYPQTIKRFTPKERDAKAVEWYVTAANLGNASAIVGLRHLYEINQAGTNLTEQEREAIIMEYNAKAAGLGNWSAICFLFQLGFNYDTGYDGGNLKEEERDAKAVKYYEMAAVFEEIQALHNLARMYETKRAGKNLSDELRIAKATELYEKAANKNSAQSAYRLGELYAEAKVGKDLPDVARLEAAKKWLALAREVYTLQGYISVTKPINLLLENIDTRLSRLQNPPSLGRPVPPPPPAFSKLSPISSPTFFAPRADTTSAIKSGNDSTKKAARHTPTTPDASLTSKVVSRATRDGEPAVIVDDANSSPAATPLSVLMNASEARGAKREIAVATESSEAIVSPASLLEEPQDGCSKNNKITKRGRRT